MFDMLELFVFVVLGMMLLSFVELLGALSEIFCMLLFVMFILNGWHTSCGPGCCICIGL